MDSPHEIDPAVPLRRRGMLALLAAGGGGVLLGGCAVNHSPPASNGTRRPGRSAPLQSAPAAPGLAAARPVAGVAPLLPQSRTPYVPIGNPAARPVTPSTQLPVVPRSAWCKSAINLRDVNPMGPIQRITVHHEGSDVFNSTSWPTVADRLAKIRTGHIGRGWADIGYHYVIAPAGHVIEGRPRSYQGAHVSENNPHNLGIMLLGNYDKQRPNAAQANSLAQLLRAAMYQHRVPLNRIYTHQEINPTACPGTSLQAHMIQIRRNRTLA